jgi:hypothetical protein
MGFLSLIIANYWLITDKIQAHRRVEDWMLFQLKKSLANSVD